MSEKDSQSNSQQQQQEGETRYNKEQYEMLKCCSDKKDMTEWNKWRKQHPNDEINLVRAPLQSFWLLGGRLENAKMWGAYLEHAFLDHAHLEHTELNCARLEHARLLGAHLEHALLNCAHLEHAQLLGAHLEHAQLIGANLKHTGLNRAYLEHAFLNHAHLEHTELDHTRLEHAWLMGAHLEQANFWQAKLQHADFSRAIVDGGTLFSEECEVDRSTKFEAVALGNMRIYPKTRQLLEYNIRRMNWEQWYKGKSKNKWVVKLRELVTSPIRWFWWISNYGLSTWRIVLTFFALAIIFATAYFAWGAVDYYYLGIKDQPGIVENLFVPIAAEGPVSDVCYGAMIYFRSTYFSVVTMTTLGFGDMYANPARLGCRWWVGHLLLIVQVILGYVLLGALITRFAVLFTAGGPAGKFTKSEKNKNAKDD